MELGRTASTFSFRTKNLDHLAAMKHNGAFLRRRVSQMNLLLATHGFRFPDGILEEIRLVPTIALEG